MIYYTGYRLVVLLFSITYNKPPLFMKFEDDFARALNQKI